MRVYNTSQRSAKKNTKHELLSLKREAAADLGCERAAYRGAGAEEIAESARGKTQLLETGDGSEGGTGGGVGAEAGDVRGVVYRHGERAHIGDVVRAGIIAVENIEKFDERSRGKAFVKCEGPADAEIPLDVGSPAEFVERSLDAVDGDAIRAVCVRDGERASGFGLAEERDFESGRKPENASQNEPVAHVFTGRTVIALGKRIERIADAVYVIEQLAQDAAPGLRFRERVIRDQIEAARDVALQVNREAIVAGAIVAFKERDVWRVGGKIHAGSEIVAAIAVIALLVGVIGAHQPLSIERMLEARGGVNGVGRAVAAINQRTSGTGGQAAGISRHDARASRRVYSLECSDPAILREVVVIEAEAGAEDRGSRLPGRISDAEARRESVAIILRRAADERDAQSLER